MFILLLIVIFTIYGCYYFYFIHYYYLFFITIIMYIYVYHYHVPMKGHNLRGCDYLFPIDVLVTVPWT